MIKESFHRPSFYPYFSKFFKLFLFEIEKKSHLKLSFRKRWQKLDFNVFQSDCASEKIDSFLCKWHKGEDFFLSLLWQIEELLGGVPGAQEKPNKFCFPYHESAWPFQNL